MSTVSVIPLLSSWEQYTTLYPSGDLHNFAHWLLSRPDPAATPSQPTPAPQPAPEPTETAGSDATYSSSLLIIRLHRILQYLSKSTVKRLGFKDMELGVLVQITLMDRPNKKELCQQMLIENSTGVEITKRLAKKGFLREDVDPDDRRSALLSLTEKAKKILQQAYEKLGAIHKDFLEGFTEEEKQDLVRLLSKLEQYHTSRINTQ